MVAAAGWLSGLAIYGTAIETADEQLKRNLAATASIGARLVDASAIEKLNTVEDEQTDTYRVALRPLRALLSSNPELRYVYSYRMRNGNVEFVLDPTPPGDHDRDGQEDKSHVGDIYESATPAMLSALTSGNPTVEDAPSTDAWGTFISGYAPIFDRGEIIGAVGVDLSAAGYQAQLAKINKAHRSNTLLAIVLGIVSALLAGVAKVRLDDARQHEWRSMVNNAQTRVLRLVAKSLPLGKLLAQICKEAESLFPGSWCSIWVHKQGGGMYRAVSHSEAYAEIGTAPSQVEVGTNIVGSDGTAFGKVMLKLPSSKECLAIAQEASDLVASLASIAIERRSAEDQLLEANEKLRHSQTVLSTEVQQRTAELEKLIASRAEFISEVSHEVRHPLNGVIGMSGLLLDTELDDEQSEYAQIIQDGARQILKLMDGLLDLSKIEAGKLVIEAEPMNMATELRATVKPVALELGRRGVAFKTYVDLALDRTALGSPLRFRQVLANLLGNAMKFTESGSISVTARKVEEGQLEFAQIEVSDTGCGIPIEIQERVFSRFVQGSQSHGGAGLGLPITKELVESMGGTIIFASEVGKGTIFTIRLPLHQHRSMAA